MGGALRRLCPSCAQKRTLLIGEYLSEDLLLRLPHRQAVQWPARGFVWTIPKVLRVFLRHDRDLFADISRLLFDILTSFFLNPDFARKLLGWEHSGFSIESGTRIWDQDSREALCQYIVRAPFSLQRIRWDGQQDAITWSSSPSGYFKRAGSAGTPRWTSSPR